MTVSGRFIGVGLALVLVSDGPTEAGDLVRVPGTEIRLAPPDGYTPATTFAGFQHVDSGSSILVMGLPGPFSRVKVSFENPRALASQKMKELASEDRAMGDLPGLLLHAEQQVPQGTYRKWIWLFGADEETTLVMGTYPEADEAQGAALRAAVTSARSDTGAVADPLEGLGYSFGDPTGLEYFVRTGQTVAYTADGEADAELSGKAILLIGPAVGRADTSDPRAFVEERLRQTAGYRSFEVESVRPTEVDGLIGFEAVAEAVSGSGVPTTIYQLVLFEGASYWVAQGLVRRDEREERLPVFRRIANGFRRDRNRIEAEDGVTRVTAPSGWTVLDLDDDSGLEIGHAAAECYLTVATDSRTDPDDGMTLSRLSEEGRAGIGGVTREVGPRTLEIAGRPAIQFEMYARVDGKDVVFLHTMIDGEELVHELLAWTTASAFDLARADLDEVIASFEEAP